MTATRSLLVIGLLAIGLSAFMRWRAGEPAAAAPPAAPPLKPAELAAGFKIGAGWDEFKVLRDVSTVDAAHASLAPGDRVLATEIDGEARAYPLAILDRHEMVADTVGKVPILASY